MKNKKSMSFATFVFMAISACFIGLTIMLFTSLSGAIDHLFMIAKTPSFLQMHTGEITEQSIKDFALKEEQIESWQVCHFLNIDNSLIFLNGKSFSENSQDNGLCVQNKEFDFLLTTDNEIAVVNEGEVYIPVCYKREYGLEKGNVLEIGEKKLVVAGFIRDSQMNSMMASSKRFLVNEQDYERCKAVGQEEYLIEFLLKEGSDINAFTEAYINAKLPNNGPTITLPLIKLMNTLSDGMMILVILIVSIVILLISMICIRFIILTTLEQDKSEIGMMKAIGISRKDIRSIYFNKYIYTALLGAFVGLVIAYFVSTPMSVQMRELYGVETTKLKTYIFSLIGVLFIEGILLLSIHKTLRKIEKLSAIQVLQKMDESKKRKKLQYLFIAVVTAASVFLCLVPQNLKSTISSPKFVTYMGVGDADIRIDVRQTEDILEKTMKTVGRLESDEKVDKYVALQTKKIRAKLSDDTTTSLLVEWGNHEVFPVTYVSGNAPVRENEIALSSLNAEDLKLSVGDKLVLSVDEKDCEYTVCGIYSDITNGGKTAKAYASQKDLQTPTKDQVMWSILYISFADESMIDDWMTTFMADEDFIEGAGMKVVDIASYVSATYGQTIRQISLASTFVRCASGVILFVVVWLFMGMIVATDRKDSSFKKAIGFTTRDIQMDYLKQVSMYALVGIFLGVLLGLFLGEKICGMILQSFGATKFKLILECDTVFVNIPVFILAVVLLAVCISLIEIKKIRAFEAL